MDKRTRRFIGLALAESAKSTYDRVKIGAVLVDKNYPVAAGANLNTSHPLQYKYNLKSGRVAPKHCLHAEMHAIVRAYRERENLNGLEMFVARLDRRGRLAMCRPCCACSTAIREAGIVAVTYTTPKGIIRNEVIL